MGHSRLDGKGRAIPKSSSGDCRKKLTNCASRGFACFLRGFLVVIIIVGLLAAELYNNIQFVNLSNLDKTT